MPTKKYMRKKSTKTRKIKRVGGTNTKSNKKGISMKNVTSTMRDLFPIEMKKSSRSQPSRAVKSAAQFKKEEEEEKRKAEIILKQTLALSKKENKEKFNKQMDELANQLEKVLRD